MNQFTICVRYTAKPGQREAFVRAVVTQGILTKIRNEEGCLAYDYYFSAQEEDVVLLVEKWASHEHQVRHMRQPHMDELMNLKEQYVAETVVRKVELSDAI